MNEIQLIWRTDDLIQKKKKNREVLMTIDFCMVMVRETKSTPRQKIFVRGVLDSVNLPLNVSRVIHER